MSSPKTPSYEARSAGRNALGRFVDAQERAGRSAREIFGSPDDLKFRSCMTLFAEASGRDEVFESALRKYYGGERDPRTLALLRG